MTPKQKKFLCGLKEVRNPIIIDIEDRYYKRHLLDLKELTANIQFPCNFDDKNKCKGMRNNKIGWVSPKNPQCCCSHCSSSYGYLSFIFKRDIPYYTSKWNNKTGFWREGKGCILDRNKRDSICLTYICHIDKKLESQLESLKLAMRMIEDKIRRFQIANREEGE